MPEGGMNPPGQEERERIGREHGVPEEAVKAHEIPERIGGPVRENQGAEGSRHEENQPDFSERFTEAVKPRRKKSLKEVNEDRKATQMERQIGGAHAVYQEKEQVAKEIPEKEQEGCDFQEAVLPFAAAAEEQEAVKRDSGCADSERREMLCREQAEPDPGGKIMNFFPEVLHHEVTCAVPSRNSSHKIIMHFGKEDAIIPSKCYNPTKTIGVNSER